MASAYRTIDFTTGLLLILGVLFAQMAVNVLNDYVDYRRGIDQETAATRFSGGKKLIVARLRLPQRNIGHRPALACYRSAISLYFAVNNPAIIPFLVVGALSILLYTSWLLYVPFVAEPIVIMNFMMIGMASFIPGSSAAHMPAIILLTFPAGAVIGMALLINEMPDRKVDAAHGRKSGAVLLKSNENNAQYYLFWQIAAYLSIAFGVIYKIIPSTELIAIASTPDDNVRVRHAELFRSKEVREVYGPQRSLLHALHIPADRGIHTPPCVSGAGSEQPKP